MSGIPVGISTCLLGKEVRHDGGHKHSRYCTQVLSKHFFFPSARSWKRAWAFRARRSTCVNTVMACA